MRLSKQTARLVREAIVLAHVDGAYWGGYGCQGTPDGPYPADSTVVDWVLESARRKPELYPLLSRVEPGDGL